MSGRLIGVVGPSGVGKDTLMQAVSAAAPEIGIVRRVITRPPGLGNESYDAVDAQGFCDLKARGAFCIDWQAHGLRYGIPNATLDRIAHGETLLVNLSRTVLEKVAGKFPRFIVLCVTAKPEVLMQRLAFRGRESAEEISKRLARKVDPLPAGLTVLEIANDDKIETAVKATLSGLRSQKV